MNMGIVLMCTGCNKPFKTSKYLYEDEIIGKIIGGKIIEAKERGYRCPFCGKMVYMRVLSDD